jgi:hypothetical protein
VTATTPSSSSPSPADAVRLLQTSVGNLQTAADTQQSDALGHLALVHSARATGLSRAAASAIAQNGADSSEAAAAKAALAAALTSASRAAVSSQQAATPAPKVAATGWVLHGRVYDSNLKPLRRHSVYLADRQNTYLGDYGVAYTDASGYFLLSSDGPKDGSAQTAEAGAAKPAAAAAPELYLQVADPKANPVYSSVAAFAPTVGAATYQVVSLAAGEPPLGDPPAAVRAAVLPPKGAKSRGS